MTSRRYLALWFPFLPTDRLRRSASGRSAAPDERPLVLVDKVRGALRLAAVDRRALDLGLAPGFTLADARARVPDLAVADHDPAADAELVERIAEDCDRWTPAVAVDPRHGLLLDVTGCAHLFDGESALRREVLTRLRRAGLGARGTIAGTPDAARALARYGRTAVAPPGEEARAVRPLPIAALDAAPETSLALVRAGLTTLGALADRPSLLLSSRFGETLTHRLDRLLGREDARITPRRLLPACAAERRFFEPVARTSDVEATIIELVIEAGRILEERGEGGRVFELAFFRSDGKIRRISAEAGRSLRDPETVLLLFRERLEALADPVDPGFGFDLIRLTVAATQPLAPTQGRLDRREVEEHAIDDLVDRLTARFGSERVLRFTPQNTHSPERAAVLRAAIDGAAAAPSWPRPVEDEPPARPLRLFDPPEPIETLAEVPDGPPVRFLWRRALHRVARAEGPERIAPEWWRRKPGAPTRDYYRVEDAEGRRFWIFRSGLYERDEGEPRWFLHGLFP